MFLQDLIKLVAESNITLLRKVIPSGEHSLVLYQTNDWYQLELSSSNPTKPILHLCLVRFAFEFFQAYLTSHYGISALVSLGF